MRIGIDLGGTNLAYGLVDINGQIIQRGAYALTDRNPEVIADLMLDIYTSLASEYSIDLVGIGVPGIVSEDDGVVITCVNLGWKMVPLATYLKARIKCDIAIGNDANAACIGEVLFGGMQGYSDAILLTLGTGVGGGVISGGKLLTGFQGAGGELGHMTIAGSGVTCNCGNVGCLETFASATAIIRYYNHVSPEAGVTEAKAIFDRYVQAEENAVATVKWFSRHLAVGIVNFYNIFAPEVIAIGGGVSKAFHLFEPLLNEAVSKRLFSQEIMYGKIVPARLHNDAGIIGAAFLDRY